MATLLEYIFSPSLRKALRDEEASDLKKMKVDFERIYHAVIKDELNKAAVHTAESEAKALKAFLAKSDPEAVVAEIDAYLEARGLLSYSHLMRERSATLSNDVPERGNDHEQ